jgi:hypothetical protein
MKVLAIAGTILFLSVFSSSVEAQASTVRVRDYAPIADCSQDQTAQVQAAIDAWIAGQPGQSKGKLDFGSGCWRTSQTLVVGRGQPVFGVITGDGPNLATIKPAQGVGRAIQFNDYWFGELSNIGVQGAYYGTHGAAGSTDQGLVFAATHVDLGSCCGIISNVSVSGFRECYQFGDTQSPTGAAAEFLLNNTFATWCGVGYSFTQLNTMDFVFNKPSVTHSDVGWKANGITQILVYGGSSTANNQDFNFSGSCGHFVVQGFRSEGGRPDTSRAMAEVGGCNGQRTVISDTVMSVSPDYQHTSIAVVGSESWLTLERNTLVGPVRVIQDWARIESHNNSIYVRDGDQPFTFADQCCGALWLVSTGDYQPYIPQASWFVGWHNQYPEPGVWFDAQMQLVRGEMPQPGPPPDQEPNVPPTPAPPTATPVPPTATPVPPTATPVPTATPQPTATLVPATATPAPDTCEVHVRRNGVEAWRGIDCWAR